MDGFTALQASRFTGTTGNQLRYWDKIGLVKPGVQTTGGRPGVRRLYGFRDLVALKVVKSLLDGGMSLQRVRRAYEYLRENARLEEELSSVKLVTDGKSIFKVTKDEGEILDMLRQGQMAFFIAIDRLAVEIQGDVTEFIRDRDQFVRTLRTVEHELELESSPRRGRSRRSSA
ncbi:MAG: MerR family transcriptional regulator [Actinobacteria bacterium]|nr:MAG: MerR family transcriptional regulator [Actinomycetota bacterium]